MGITMAYEMVCLVNAELYPTFIRCVRPPQREEGSWDICLLLRMTAGANRGQLTFFKKFILLRYS